jgi:hypothetical protein
VGTSSWSHFAAGMGKFGRLVKSTFGIKKLGGGSRLASDFDADDRGGGGGEASAPMPHRADPKQPPAAPVVFKTPPLARRDDAPASTSFSSSEEDSPPAQHGGKLAALLKQGVRIDASPGVALPETQHGGASPTIAPPPNERDVNLGSPFGSPAVVPTARAIALPPARTASPTETIAEPQTATTSTDFGLFSTTTNPADLFHLFPPASPTRSQFASPFSSPDAFERRADERRARAENRDVVVGGVAHVATADTTGMSLPQTQPTPSAVPHARVVRRINTDAEQTPAFVDPATVAKAVTTVQSYARGALARSETARKRAARRADLLRLEEQIETNAATRIQALVRGVHGRKLAQATRRRRGGEQRVAAIEQELAALRAAVMANAKAGVPRRSPEIQGDWRRGGVDRASARSAALLSTTRTARRPAATPNNAPRFFTPKTSTRRPRGYDDDDDDDDEKSTPSTSGSGAWGGSTVSSSSSLDHGKTQMRSLRVVSVSKRLGSVTHQRAVPVTQRAVPVVSVSKHSVSPGSRVVAAAEALARRYHESPLWDVAGYDEPETEKKSFVAREPRAWGPDSRSRSPPRTRTMRVWGRNTGSEIAPGRPEECSLSSGVSDGSSGSRRGRGRRTVTTPIVPDSIDPSWSPSARLSQFHGQTTSQKLVTPRRAGAHSPGPQRERPPWVGAAPPPSVHRNANRNANARSALRNNFVTRNAQATSPSPPSLSRNFEFVVGEDLGDEVVAAENERGAAAVAAAAVLSAGRAYFASFPDTYVTSRIRLGPVSLAAAFAVGATAAAAPWVAPAVAPGLSAVRAFPIYHIPQTDCPYETDTFFFISQALGIEPAWRGGGDSFGGFNSYARGVSSSGQRPLVAALDSGDSGVSVLLQLRLAEIEEKLGRAETALGRKNQVHEVDVFDEIESENRVGRRRRRFDGDVCDGFGGSRSRSASASRQDSHHSSDGDAFHSPDASFDGDDDDDDARDVGIGRESSSRERELELETKRLRELLETREKLIRDPRARALAAELRVAEAETETEVAIAELSETAAVLSSRKNADALDEEITRLRRAALVFEKRCQLDVEGRVEELREAHSVDVVALDATIADAEKRAALAEQNRVTLTQKLATKETESEALLQKVKVAETAARDAETARALIAAASDGGVSDALAAAAAAAAASGASEARAVDLAVRVAAAETTAEETLARLTQRDAQLETLASTIRLGEARARDADVAIDKAEARADAAEAQATAAAAELEAERVATALRASDPDSSELAEARREAELVRARLMLERDDALDAAEALSRRTEAAERRVDATATALDYSKSALADAEARVVSLALRVDTGETAAAGFREAVLAATAAAAAAEARAGFAESLITKIEHEAAASAAERIAAEQEASSSLIESLRTKLHDTREALERANLDAARVSQQRSAETAAARDAAASLARREAERLAVADTAQSRDALSTALADAKAALDIANARLADAERRAWDAEAETTEATRVMSSSQTDARAVALAARLKTAEEQTRVAIESTGALEKRFVESEKIRGELWREKRELERLLEEKELLEEKQAEENGDDWSSVDSTAATENVPQSTSENSDIESLRLELTQTRASLDAALSVASEAQAVAQDAEKARDAAVTGTDPDVGGVVFAMRRERAALRERLAQAEEERSYFSTKLDESLAEAAVASASATRKQSRRVTLERPSDTQEADEPATSNYANQPINEQETAAARVAAETALEATRVDEESIRAASEAENEAKRLGEESRRRASDAETERVTLESAAKKRREDLGREQEAASRRREAELQEARQVERRRHEEEDAASAVRREKETKERVATEAARAVAQQDADEASRKKDEARVAGREKKRLEKETARVTQEKDQRAKLEKSKENAPKPPPPDRGVPKPAERRSLGQTSAAGRKTFATRAAETSLAAAKQAWRRAETAAARAKQLREELTAAPADSAERQRLALETADAADEARAAKAQWQEALGKAEASMEEAKKGRDKAAWAEKRAAE